VDDIEWLSATGDNPLGGVGGRMQLELECEGISGTGSEDSEGNSLGLWQLHQAIDNFVNGPVATYGADAVDFVDIGCCGDFAGMSRVFRDGCVNEVTFGQQCGFELIELLSGLSVAAARIDNREDLPAGHGGDPNLSESDGDTAGGHA
jgi:hypothetical protein